MVRVDIIKSEKAGFESPITRLVNVSWTGKLSKAWLRVVLTPSFKGLINSHELRQFTVNGHVYYPSNIFNSTNCIIIACGGNESLMQGENRFTFAWATTIGAPDGKIDAWLELEDGFIVGAPTEVTNIGQRISDFIKENIPITIAILVIVAVIVASIAWIVGRVPITRNPHNILGQPLKKWKVVTINREGKQEDFKFALGAKSNRQDAIEQANRMGATGEIISVTEIHNPHNKEQWEKSTIDERKESLRKSIPFFSEVNQEVFGKMSWKELPKMIKDKVRRKHNPNNPKISFKKGTKARRIRSRLAKKFKKIKTVKQPFGLATKVAKQKIRSKQRFEERIIVGRRPTPKGEKLRIHPESERIFKKLGFIKKGE